MSALARSGAQPHSEQRSADGRFAALAIQAARADLGLVPRAAAEHWSIWSLYRSRPLPHIAGHVIGTHRAARAGMGADLVGAEPERLAAVGDVDVGVVGSELRAAGEDPRVGPAGGALPLVLVAHPRSRDAPAAIEPGGERLGI